MFWNLSQEMLIFVARPFTANNHGEVKDCASGKGTASKWNSYKLASNLNAFTESLFKLTTHWEDRRQEHAKTHTIALNTNHTTVTTDPNLKHTPDIPDIHDGQQITQWMRSFNWNEWHDWHAASARNALTLMRESTHKKILYWAECMTVLQNINAVIITTRNIEINDMTEVSHDSHDCHDPMARRILITGTTLADITVMITVTAITKITHKAELARLTRFRRLAWLTSLTLLTSIKTRRYWHEEQNWFT